MLRMNRLKFPNAVAMERWPWALRGLLGFVSACLAVSLTYSVQPLRAFPLLLAFPTVVLTSWFLGMWGGVLCAITDAILVDTFLTRPQSQFSIGNAREELRLALFLFVSIFLGWTIRRLAQQRSQLATQQLQQRLMLADTERQLAEERAAASNALRDRDALLQLALSANGMGLWVWDIEQGKVHRSDEMFRMLGREPGSFGPDPDEWLKYVHDEDREGLIAEFERLRESASDYHRQYRVLWPDGSVHWLESQGKCQMGADGRVTRIVGVMADITHRKHAEEAMLRAEKLAVAGKLAASVAHEINNPLASVANLLYLITMAETTEIAHAQADKALEELMRVSLITQQTLKFHRQAGSPRITHLSEVVESMTALFRGRLLAAQIEVELRVQDETPVACMPGETQQIFANLLSNAIEAMQRGGRLIVRLRRSRDWRDGATPGMRVTFCDSGAGMDRATMHRVFEPFFTTKPDTGTGLGLWVVAQLVERHSGQVRVWSWQRPQSSGTAFTVFLPLGNGASAEEAAENGVQAAPVLGSNG
jgi:signal transduction histidine kinase